MRRVGRGRKFSGESNSDTHKQDTTTRNYENQNERECGPERTGSGAERVSLEMG